MQKNTRYFVRVDKYGVWTPTEYREVTRDELDSLIIKFGNRVLDICSRGQEGAMIMWAFFKSRIRNGSYEDMINAYRLMSTDHKSLVDRETEIRHLWQQYEELWQIRYYRTVEEYYLKKAEEARQLRDSHLKNEGGNQ